MRSVPLDHINLPSLPVADDDLLSIRRDQRPVIVGSVTPNNPLAFSIARIITHQLKLVSLREAVFIFGIREPYNPRMAAGKFLDCCAIDSGRRGIRSLLGAVARPIARTANQRGRAKAFARNAERSLEETKR